VLPNPLEKPIVLLDTNIFILREDNKIIPQEIQTLLKILEKIKAEILIHPMSVRELKKDKNENRREIILSKMKLYQQLESPPEFLEDKIFRSKLTEGNEHEKIDNNILYAVYKDAVEFYYTGIKIYLIDFFQILCFKYQIIFWR